MTVGLSNRRINGPSDYRYITLKKVYVTSQDHVTKKVPSAFRGERAKLISLTTLVKLSGTQGIYEFSIISLVRLWYEFSLRFSVHINSS